MYKLSGALVTIWCAVVFFQMYFDLVIVSACVLCRYLSENSEFQKHFRKAKKDRKFCAKWNKLLEFYISIWPKVSLCLCVSEPALPTDPISPRFQSACCNQTPCFFSAALVVHSRRTTFLFKFFRFTPHSDGVKRTGTFHNSQEKSTHMQIFSIAPEI